MSSFGFSELAQGRIPLWSAYNFSGYPFAANFESALFYPPNWLHLLLPTPWAFNLLVFFHLFLAAAGFYFWARTWGLGRSASWVSSVLFVLSGAFITRYYAGQISNVYSMSWAPFIFWGLERLKDRATVKRWVHLVVGIAMQILAGHPQYALYTAMGAFFYSFILFSQLSILWRRLAFLASAYGAAAVLDSVQVLNGLSTLAYCRRNLPLSLDVSGYNSLSPVYGLTLVSQYAFGRDFKDFSLWPYFPYYGGNLWENNLFIGGVAFWMAVLALLLLPRGKWAPAGCCAILAGFLSLGSYAPFYSWWVNVLPFFTHIRGSNKFTFLFVMMICLLAGAGWDLVRKDDQIPMKALRWIWAFAALWILAGVVWMASAYRGPRGSWWGLFFSISSSSHILETINPQKEETFVRWMGYNFGFCWVLTGMEALLLAGLLWIGKGKKTLSGLIAWYMVLNVVLFAKANYRDFPVGFQEAKTRALRGQLKDRAVDRRIWLAYGESMTSLEKNLWGVNTFAPGRYVDFLTRTQGTTPEKVMNSFEMTDPGQRALGLLRVTEFFNNGPEGFQAVPLNVQVIPRFQLLGHWERALGAADSLSKVLAPDFVPSKTMILEDGPDPLPEEGKKGKVEGRDLSSGRIDLHIQSDHPTLLFIGENYLPGWRVRDLLPRAVQPHYQVLECDHFLRAVPLAAGNHHFQMVYEPMAFRLGLWMSLVALSSFILLGFWVFRGPHKGWPDRSFPG